MSDLPSSSYGNGISNSTPVAGASSSSSASLDQCSSLKMFGDRRLVVDGRTVNKKELELMLIDCCVPEYLVTAVRNETPSIEVIEGIVNYAAECNYLQVRLNSIVFDVKTERDKLKSMVVDKNIVSKDDYDQLKSQKEATDLQYREIAEDLASRNSEFDELTEKLQSQINECRQLQHDKAELMSLLNAISIEKNNLADDLANRKADLNRFNEKYRAQQDELNKMHNDNVQLILTVQKLGNDKACLEKALMDERNRASASSTISPCNKQSSVDWQVRFIQKAAELDQERVKSTDYAKKLEQLQTQLSMPIVDQEKADLAKKVEQLQTLLSTSNQEKADLVKKIENLQTLLSMSNVDQIRRLAGKNAELHQLVDAKNKEIFELQKSGLSADVAQLTSKVSELQQQLEAKNKEGANQQALVDGRVLELSKKNEELEEKCRKHASEVMALVQVGQKELDKCRALEKELEAKVREVCSIRLTIDEKEKLTKELKDSIGRHESTISSLNGQLVELNNKMLAAIENVDRLKAENEKLDKAMKADKELIAVYKQQITEWKKDNDAKLREISRLNQRINQLSGGVSQNNQEADALRREIEDKSQQVAAKEVSIKKLTDDIAELKSKLDDKDRSIENLTGLLTREQERSMSLEGKYKNEKQAHLKFATDSKIRSEFYKQENAELKKKLGDLKRLRGESETIVVEDETPPSCSAGTTPQPSISSPQETTSDDVQNKKRRLSSTNEPANDASPTVKMPVSDDSVFFQKQEAAQLNQAFNSLVTKNEELKNEIKQKDEKIKVLTQEKQNVTKQLGFATEKLSNLSRHVGQHLVRLERPEWNVVHERRFMRKLLCEISNQNEEGEVSESSAESSTEFASDPRLPVLHRLNKSPVRGSFRGFSRSPNYRGRGTPNRGGTSNRGTPNRRFNGHNRRGSPR